MSCPTSPDTSPPSSCTGTFTFSPEVNRCGKAPMRMRATPMTPERPIKLSRTPERPIKLSRTPERPIKLSLCGTASSASSVSWTGRPVRRRLSLADRRGSAQSLTFGMAKLGLCVEGGRDNLDSPFTEIEDTRDDTASEQQRELLFETATVVMKRLSRRLSFGETQTADSDGYDSTSSGYVSDHTVQSSPEFRQKKTKVPHHQETPSPASKLSPLARRLFEPCDLDLNNLTEAIEEQEDADEAVPDWAKGEFAQFLANLEYVPTPTPKRKVTPAQSRAKRASESYDSDDEDQCQRQRSRHHRHR